VNLAAVLVAGTPTLTGLVRAAKTRQLSVAVLIGIAALSALALGDWLEAASVLLISVVGEALERQSLKRSHQDVFAVHMLGAKAALVKHEGKLVELPVHKVRRGQILVIRQGMKVPVDGTVKDGGGQVNEAALTGESAFRTKSPGDRVSAGTLLEAGALEIEAVSVGGDTAIAQIAKLVEKARHEKTAAEKMVDRFARLLIPAILLIAAGALAAKKRVSAES
jgi:Cd2+/Zn2+-exporting ATPase